MHGRFDASEKEPRCSRRSLLVAGGGALGTAVAPPVAGQSAGDQSSVGWPGYGGDLRNTAASENGDLERNPERQWDLNVKAPVESGIAVTDGDVYAFGSDGGGETHATGETVGQSFETGTRAVSLGVVDDERGQANTTTEISVDASGQAAGSGSEDGPIAAHVDRIPGDELGVAGGAAGLLGLFGLYRLLARRRSGSPDTRSKTVAGPTAGHGSSRSSEAASQAESGAGAGSADPADATFDAFEMGETLGSGALTQVTDGRYRPDGTPVVVETLAGSPGHTVHEALFERFTDGVEVWSEIDDHPNVITVFSSGTAPYPWAALERCSSPLNPETVSDRSFEEIQSFLVDVLEGVHEGHRAGLYHGALTPSNVMLVERDEEQVAAVGDWEVSAAQLDPALNVAEVYPRFATPEQVDPDRFRDPDSLTDVYQVGVLTYALTTGSYPFDGPPDGDRDADELISPSEFASDVPEELEGVLTTAIATDPRRRYQTALHFRDALDRF